MENLSMIIGHNLYDIRKKKNLSLDKAAELTGVSKPMLGQIERGLSNPSVTVLWKIATGLNVSFSYFLNDSGSEVRHVSFKDLRPVQEEDGSMTVYPLFPYDEKRRFEIFTIHLQPGCDHASVPHSNEVEEYVLVTQGEMELIVADTVYRLSAGDAVSFAASRRHSYRNPFSEPARFNNIILYRA
ncbi:MAG TPA: XRE family transcriptional regulator [Patescibacteria group bacterium]|nr:XRE family transcriptional regulator [Patescibacteria group bacterium]